MPWVQNQSGGVAASPREFDVFYLNNVDGPPMWWRFWYADSTQEGGYFKGWEFFVKEKWYEVDLTAVGIPANAKAVFLHCMLDITYRGRGIQEIWATVVAPSAKGSVGANDITGRPYGTRTFRSICMGDGIRDEQSTWVAVENGKISIRASANWGLSIPYPKASAMMIRISAAAYLL